MKNFVGVLLLTIGVSFIGFAQKSWKASDFQPVPYKKVLVQARIADDLNRRQLEDATVKAFAEKGLTAIPAYSNIKESDLSSDDAFLNKIEKLGVDGLLVYNITGQNTKYKYQPSVDLNLGTNVRVGFLRGYVGTNVPIAGGGTKTVNSVKVTAAFYDHNSADMQWSYPLSGKVKNNTSKLANTFAQKTVGQMNKDGLF